MTAETPIEQQPEDQLPVYADEWRMAQRQVIDLQEQQLAVLKQIRDELYAIRQRRTRR